MRGYCGIGVLRPKSSVNIGTLWRSAHSLSAAFVFTVGARYQSQRSDTTKAPRHLPLWHFTDMEALRDALDDVALVGVELLPKVCPLPVYQHPERAVYLLGAEDDGLDDGALAACSQLVRIPSDRCLNVAAAGSIVLYDRLLKGAS